MQPMVKRLIVAIITAFLVGMLFNYINSVALLKAENSLVIFATAFFIGIAGVVTLHPLFGFRMYLIRGAAIGALVALVAHKTGDWGGILLAGAVLGIVIDFVATTVAGEGKKLLHPRNT
tara:strand:+ start:5015 stop:5371 length:357 start_codon:yes stop_codon:yes gene_type:complete